MDFHELASAITMYADTSAISPADMPVDVSTANALESSSISKNQTWIPPSVQRKMEEEAALSKKGEGSHEASDENSVPNTQNGGARSSEAAAGDQTQTTVQAATAVAAAPSKQKWVPPSVRRKMEAEAAATAEAATSTGLRPTEEAPAMNSEVAAGSLAETSAGAAEATETAPVTKPKWVPPSVRRRMEAEAAAAAANAGATAGSMRSTQEAVFSTGESVPSTDFATASSTDSSALEGLPVWLDELGLFKYLPAAKQWCDDQGAGFMTEVFDNVTDLVEALGLDPDEKQRATERAQQRLAEIQQRKPSEPSLERGAPGLTLRHHSTLPGKADTPSSRINLRIVATLKTKASKVVKKLGSREHCSGSRKSSNDPAEEHLSRTSTAAIAVHGPNADHIASLQCHDAPPEVHEVEDKCEFDGLQRQASVYNVYKKDGKKPTALYRRGTCGLEERSHRDRLKEDIAKNETRKVNMDEGQTGTVFALESGGKRIAVFKPQTGENFKRKGLETGKGAVREEAVYLVDRLCGGQANVPVTSRASIDIDGNTKLEGSVQEYVPNVMGFIEDFAMPRDLEAARGFVCQNAAEALALLDMRVFNMDRHPGNLLLRYREKDNKVLKVKPYELGVIDHGCCLPAWWCLSEAIFDAWRTWPQLYCEPSEYAQKIAIKAKDLLCDTCAQVKALRLDEASIVTLRICVEFIYIGVAVLKLPIGKLAELMLRDEDTGFEEMSWLESKVLICAQGAGAASCRMEVNQRGEQEMTKPEEGELQEKEFFSRLESLFDKELCEACGLPIRVESEKALICTGTAEDEGKNEFTCSSPDGTPVERTAPGSSRRW
mmetsp:Transcript_84758/g.162123  ORF Transcript_84758/g.162123 Transcript_84758/m.162123 type:complete len:832 (+) Transcript_84758:57-2552(+)